MAFPRVAAPETDDRGLFSSRPPLGMNHPPYCAATLTIDPATSTAISTAGVPCMTAPSGAVQAQDKDSAERIVTQSKRESCLNLSHAAHAHQFRRSPWRDPVYLSHTLEAADGSLV